MRTMIRMLLVLTIPAAVTEALQACGDKFIRIGREVRFGRYVAIYPASILVYAPSRSAPSRIADLGAILKRAGHAPTIVTSPSEMASALRDGKFELVLAGLDQAAEVVRQARLAASHPDVMPVLIKPGAGELAQAAALSTCRIDASAPHRNDALAEIDHRMELRLKGTAPDGSR